MMEEATAMVAEAMAESPNTVLLEELMIEILYRVELDNTVQLRCVCKLWNSLVLHPQFMKKHFQISITDIANQFAKTFKEINVFKSYFITNPSVRQEEEDGEDNNEEEEEEEEADEAAEEDDDEEETEEGDADDEEEDEEKQHLMNAFAQLDNLMKDMKSEEEDEHEEREEGEGKQWIRNEMAVLDYFLVIIRYLKGKYEAFIVDMQTVEDRVKCLQSFLQFYLKSPTSSSSH